MDICYTEDRRMGRKGEGGGGGGSVQKRELDTLSCDFHSRAKGQRGYSIDKNIGDELMGPHVSVYQMLHTL